MINGQKEKLKCILHMVMNLTRGLPFECFQYWMMKSRPEI